MAARKIDFQPRHETIAVLEALEMPEADRDAIYFGNAEAMLTTNPLRPVRRLRR